MTSYSSTSVPAPAGAASGEGRPACPNCGTAVNGRFCSSCGQRHGALMPALGELIREAVREGFDLDGRLPRTLWALVARPGHLTNEWFAGRRADYVGPIRLYLLASFLFFGAVSLFGFPIDYVDPGVALSADDPRDATALLVEARFQLMATIAVLAMIPLLGLTWIVSDNQGREPIQYMVAALHLVSFLYLLAAPLWVLYSLGVPSVVLQPTALLVLLYHGVRIEQRVFQRTPRQALSLRIPAPTQGRLLLLAVLIAAFGAVGALMGYTVEDVMDRVDEAPAVFAGFLYDEVRSAAHQEQEERAEMLRSAAITQYNAVGTGNLGLLDRVKLAELNLAAGQAGQSLAILDDILEDEPDHAAGLVLAAEAAERMGRQEEAAERRRRLADLPEDAWIEAFHHYGMLGNRLRAARETVVRSQEAARISEGPRAAGSVAGGSTAAESVAEASR